MLAEAVSGTPEPAAAHAEQAERAAPGDPWALYAKAAAAAAGRSRDRAVQALSRPGRRSRGCSGRTSTWPALPSTVATPGCARVLQRVLRNNPQHERARRMLSLLPP